MITRVIAAVLAIAATASFAEPGRPVPGSTPSPAVVDRGDDVAAPSDSHGPDLAPYRGLATWVDVHDDSVYRRPEAAVEAMRRRGVTTLYLETAHYNTPRAIHRPDVVSRLVDAAHQRNLHVVAWYLPSFTDVDRDLRRSLAAIRFTSATGRRFDSFALDIEAPIVSDVAVRNRRLLRLSRRIRAAVGDTYALGAIVPEAGASYWPGFPYEHVARHYDVFLPMAYHSFRIDGAADVGRYAQHNADAIRRLTGDEEVPIHMIGGLAEDASPAEVRAFVRASRTRGALGVSLYDFATTTDRQWEVLARTIR